MADEKNIPLYVDPTILARDLSNSLSVASRSTTSPDDESQLRAASRRLGIPLETARTDPAATKQAVAQESFDATDYAKRFPTSAAYLANPDNALVARDDVEPLSAVEQAIRGQIQQNMLGDLGADPAQAATDRLLPDYAAERREREQVLRTEGFAAASALSRRQQQRRELLRATGSIGEIRQPEPTPGNILSGLATDATTGFKSAKLGLAQQIGDLFGDNEERTEQYNRQRGQLDFERQLATPEFDTNVARWTYGGFSSLAQTAPAVGLSIATGSPALGLSMMGLQTYGEAYGRYRGRDASRGMASLGAAGEASVEVLTEILPMRFAVDRLGKAGLTQFFAGFLGRDMAGEQIATLAQDAIDTAIANPTKTWNDYLAERPEAAIQTAFATLVQSGTLAAIGEGVGRLAGTIDREQYAADTANQNAQQLADLMTAAAASMTRQRDPQTFAQLVQGAAEDSGSSPTEIFIDARILAPLLESAGMTPEQLAQSLPSVQEQLEEALATDGAVAIPIGEATAAFAGSGLEQELVRNARVSEDAWTAAEAEEGAQLLAQLEQDAQKVLAEQTEAQAWEDSSNAVFDTLMGELSSAGRFTPDVNRAYATLVRNFYAVQASKLGITPQEMYARFPLTVTSRAPGQQQSQVLDQYASSVTPEAKPGALTVQGVHFSTARRATLDGRFFGTGLKGAERARLAGLPEDSPLRSRVLAYVDEGAGVRPEQGVGSVEHGVTMSNIYDTGKDPLGLWTGADANTREQAVLDAGFDGYYVPGVMAVGGGKTSGVVALLGEAAYNVPTTERAAPVEAAAQAQSPLQAALDALDNSNRLPAGQIAPSRLGELTERLEPELYAALAPTGMFEGNEPRYRADIIADARNSEVFNQSLSTRAPSAVRATEDALANVLAIDFDSVLADEKTLTKNAAILRALPNMRPTKARKPAKVVEQFVEHVVDNLLFLHDLMPAEQRDRAKLWYDGGRKMAEAWANRYGISEMQAAAAIAVLSPQNDWFQNVSAAERTADILFGMRDFQWDDAMSVEADRILGDKTDPKMELARGKKLSELLDRPDLAARWVRVFDQTHNSRAFNVLTPEGGAAGLRTTASGNPATMAWKTYDNIAAAVSIYLDGRAENVFHQLGREHKVRNFYNNIFDPKSEMGFATIDTHAVAAALLRPLAGADLEVTQNFGGAGSASSSITGLSGTYPIYLEAYRRAAEARGLLPREMQSITWEAVRGLFEGPRKNAMKAPANAIWERYKAGEIDQAQAQAEIVKLAGHITPPTWTEAEFNDTPGRTYEGDAQRAIDERGEAGAAELGEARVMFEVAPDPNDAALTEQWNALSDAERLEISQQVAAQVVPKVLAELSTTGDFVMQLGGYLGATNPSMTLRLDRPELAVQAAKLLGHALAQDSMMVVTETQAIGTEPVGAVTISLPEGYGANEVTALYDRLFELQENGEPLVGGHTTANGQMTILNYSPLSDDELARRIQDHLGSEFDIDLDRVYSAFPQKSEYGYGDTRQEGATAPGKSSAQRRPDRLRSEATQLVREALAARAEPAVLNQGGLTDGTGNRTGRYSSGSLAPLEGAPTVEGATGPDPRLVAVAEQYARDNGIPLRRQAEFVEVDPERAARIAAAYEAMPHAPQDPAVKEAFENLIQQTMAQYRALEAAGYQFFLIDETNDPYAGNPWNAMRDLRANQRMGVFATEAGFGSGATELNVDDNPLLADTGLQWPYGSPEGQPKRVLANDLFRAVHDAFGNGLEGAGFRARGEENAWQAHVRLFTGSAVGAITTETRGQNSWLNYGPYGEQNRTAKVEDTVFADQKTGLMPEWTWTEGRVADEAEQGDVFNQSAQTDTILVEGIARPTTDSNGAPLSQTEEGIQAFWRWFGDSKIVDDQGRPLVVYHSTLADKQVFDKHGQFMGYTGVSGISVTDNPEMASRYLDRYDEFGWVDGKPNQPFQKNVMPLYVRAENPLERDEPIRTNIPLGAPLPEGYVSEVEKQGYDALIRNDAISRKGGVKHSDAKNAIRGREIVVFDPTQIKSAIGNTGGFDPADPNILYQSAQTETPAFNAWFGGSKVVDENGQPLVVYHGTGADIAQFNTEGRGKTAGSGSFFSSSPAIAATYATGESPNVTPAYLSLKAPVVVDAGGANWARLGRKVKVSMPAVEVSDQSDEDLLAELEERAPQKGVTKKLKAKTATLGKLFPGELVYDDDYASTDDLARWARAQGYDGIIIKNVMDHGPSGRFATDNRVSDIYVAFRPEQIKSAIGNTGGFDPADPNILNQPGQARATFNPATLEISLLEKADLSSFLHETGHFFFEMQATLAAQPNAPAEIVADMQTLLDHVGYTGTAAEWLAQPLNARREAHETIAETFEQYLFEGKAPSAELQSVFRRFRSWLISVYRSLQQMLATNERASLNPEVAAVFDRMIATDEAIAAAQAVRQFEPLFRSAEDAGMEPEAWAEYQATLQEQQAEAIEELQARTLRDLKWLDNARGRKLKELQKAAQALRKAVRDEVTAEVNEQPIYKAMEFLKFGSLTDEDGSQIQIEVTKAAKLNITELERMYPEGELGTGVEWRKLGYGKYGMLSDAGLHPDTVAEMFGFRSGRQLVTELLNAEPKASVIEGMTDQRMLERHGDISSPEAMAEAANEALANDARARLVATELKAVTKATGSPTALTRAARQAAEQIVAAKPVRNLRPDLAAASAARARKAAEKAMASGDTAAAAQAKRTEILQVQLERAQRRTQQEYDKALAGFKKIFKGTNEKLAKSRDVAMVTAARAVLARYGLAPNTSAANAQAYQQLLENYDGAMAADIKSILQGLPPSVDFRDLTVEQFRGMRDVVNGLYYLSRRTRQMEIDGQKVDIDAIADEIVTVVTERSGGTIPPLPGYTGTPTGLDKWKASLLSAKASLTRVEAWADNWGPVFKRYIWQPVSEATTVMRDKRNALVAQYRDLLKSIEKGITYNKIDAPELGPAGFVFNAGKSELLHAVLHSGNQSNLTKLLLGRGWGTLNANGQLDTSKWDQFITRMINEGVLTKADFDFAQGVWDLLETVKKDAQAAHKEMYGYYFNEVTADPINTPFGTYRGGYVPALADSLSSPDMAQKREQEELLHAGNSFMFPTTGKGFTQSRVFYNKPLELDLRAIGQHLDKVSRFAYLEPTIRDVAQLMGNKRVARALNGASPGAISDMLTPWLQRTARQSASMPGKNPKMNRFFKGLRSRTGLLFMFGNIVNTLQQLTGFSLAALKVPAPKLLRATAGYLAHPLKMRQQVGERSPWLAERMANQSYAMQDQIDQILTNPNPYEKFTDFVRRHAYFLQQAMQNVMDPIIWTGAYDHAIAQGATEKEARRYADETVRTTQGSFAPEDISAFEVQSPFVRLFTQFYGYFNMWGNLIGNEANKAVREAGFVRASPRLMFIWFAGLAIPAFVAELVSQGAPDDEDDEDGDGLLDEWLAMFFGSQAKSLATMIPIAGHGAVLVANQSDSRVWNDRLNVGPALSAGESAGKGLAAILTGEVFDEEFTKTEFRSLLTLMGLGTGLPVAPVARAGGYLFDVESGRKDPQSAAEMGIGIATGR